MEEFHKPGIWWLPENQNQALNGTIDHIPGETIDLSVYGSFGGPNPIHGSSHNYIYGHANRRPITLRACVPSSSNLELPGVTTTTYSALQIYSGAHVLPENEMLFSEWSVELCHFQTWLGENGLTTDFTENEGERTMTVSLRILPDIPLMMRDDVSVTASFSGNAQNMDYTYRRSSINQRTKLRIIPTEPQHEQWFVDMVHHWCHLLTLLVGRPVKVISIDAKSPQFTFELEGTEHQTSIEIGRLQRISESDLKFGHPQEMVLPRQRITEIFPQIAERFFEIEPIISPALNLFIENEFSTSSIGEVKFFKCGQSN
jgi:hypothetical protein